MTPESFIDHALAIPFAFERGDWMGCDCWGLVELWYFHLLGITVNDRAGHGANHAALQAGFDAATRWHKVDAPADHDLVVMRAGKLEAGHIGVHWQGSILHTAERTGSVLQSLNDRALKARITGFLTYR